MIIDYKDIDLIKRNCTKIHAFGLGFIQIKLGEERRIHLYTSKVKLTSEPEEFHDHRYTFYSWILQGTLHQDIVEVHRGVSIDNHTLEYVTCDAEKSSVELLLPSPAPVSLVSQISCEFVAGSSYRLEADTFHRVSAKENTITFLRRFPKTKNFAAVIKSAEKANVCPFSANTLSEDELWEIYSAAVA
jgi:hypothetical protein